MAYFIFTVIAAVAGGVIASFFTTLGWSIAVGFIIFVLLWMIRVGAIDDVFDVLT